MVSQVASAALGMMGCLLLLAGCAEVVVPGALAGGGEYYHYTTSNIAKETLMGDEREVTEATRTAKNEPEHWKTRGWFALAAFWWAPVLPAHRLASSCRPWPEPSAPSDSNGLWVWEQRQAPLASLPSCLLRNC